jgi:hypothetical protein
VVAHSYNLNTPEVGAERLSLMTVLATQRTHSQLKLLQEEPVSKRGKEKKKGRVRRKEGRKGGRKEGRRIISMVLMCSSSEKDALETWSENRHSTQ